MINPFQQTNMPNAADFQDPLGFVTKLWGGMKLPGMVTPTVSLDELEQQIKDLKAVESWLSLNMTMLRSSIQALEVQRSTIAALKAMGESFTWQNEVHVKSKQVKKDVVSKEAEAAQDELDKTESTASADHTQTDQHQAWAIPSEANTWWNVVQDQFRQALSQVAANEDNKNSSKTTNAKMKSTATKSAKTVKSKPKTTPAASVKQKVAVKKTNQ